MLPIMQFSPPSSRNLVNEEALAHWGAIGPNIKKVVAVVTSTTWFNVK
jgi:hypothetical protein